jgi:hypothetical protein
MADGELQDLRRSITGLSQSWISQDGQQGWRGNGDKRKVARRITASAFRASQRGKRRLIASGDIGDNLRIVLI